MEGGEFHVSHRGNKKLLEIAEDGRIVLCDIKLTSEPKIPSNMSLIPYFRVGTVEQDDDSVRNVTENEFVQLFTLVFASVDNVYYLEDIKCIKGRR